MDPSKDTKFSSYGHHLQHLSPSRPCLVHPFFAPLRVTPYEYVKIKTRPELDLLKIENCYYTVYCIIIIFGLYSFPIPSLPLRTLRGGLEDQLVRASRAAVICPPARLSFLVDDLVLLAAQGRAMITSAHDPRLPYPSVNCKVNCTNGK